KKKRRDSQKMPPGSPPHQPPPPSLLAGPFGTSGSPGASGSSQVPPPPPPPPSTNQEGQLHGSTAPSSSKTDASAKYKAWTTTDTRLSLSVSSTPENLYMDDDMALDAQPLEEDIPATPEPAWSIPQSDVPVLKNNWASALASTYLPLLEDSLLMQTGDLEYLRYDNKGSKLALSILKMKVVYYPDVGLEQVMPDQMWIEEECKHTSEGNRKAVRTHIRILSVVKIKVFSMYGYDYMKKIVLRRADLNENIIAERDFKCLYPNDFEDLYSLNLQGHLNHLPPKDKKILTIAVNLWTRHLVIRQRVEDFQLEIESYQTQLNLTKPR
nr:hypothetical protein [Tanacetum cinerariifolium]